MAVISLVVIVVTGCSYNAPSSSSVDTSDSLRTSTSTSSFSSASVSESSGVRSSSLQSSSTSASTSQAQTNATLAQATKLLLESGTVPLNAVASKILAESDGWILVLAETPDGNSAICIFHVVNGTMKLVIQPNSELDIAEMTKVGVPLDIQAVAMGKTIDQVKQSDDYKYPFLTDLPYRYQTSYDNNNYGRDITISYDTSPDKPNPIAIFIRDQSISPDPGGDKQYAIDYTKNWIKQHGGNPDNCEIIYAYEPINNN